MHLAKHEQVPRGRAPCLAGWTVASVIAPRWRWMSRETALSLPPRQQTPGLKRHRNPPESGGPYPENRWIACFWICMRFRIPCCHSAAPGSRFSKSAGTYQTQTKISGGAEAILHMRPVKIAPISHPP